MVAEAQSDRIHSKALPDLISKLLGERQAMLVLFNELVALKPYMEVSLARPLLQQFCQLLMDYLALGHFEVYQCLEERGDDRECYRHLRHLARELYPQLAQITQDSVNFNDRYDGEDNCQVLDALGDDLSFLGERLADRIELEDQLIAATRAALRKQLE